MYTYTIIQVQHYLLMAFLNFSVLVLRRKFEQKVDLVYCANPSQFLELETSIQCNYRAMIGEQTIINHFKVYMIY